MNISLPGENKPNELTLDDVWYAPSINQTLISVSCLAKAGITSTFDEVECSLREKNGGWAASVPMTRSGLYRVVRDIAGAVEDGGGVDGGAGRSKSVQISVGELQSTSRTHLTCSSRQAGP